MSPKKPKRTSAFQRATRSWSSGRHDYGRRNNVHTCTCSSCNRKFWGKKLKGENKLCGACVVESGLPDSELAFYPFRYLTDEEIKKIYDRYKAQGVKVTRRKKRVS